MKIEILKEVVDLSQTLNFTQTAQNFFLTQPTLSRHILSLEKELGVTIFERSQHKVEITEEGRLVVKYAKRIKVEHDRLIRALEELQIGFKSSLTIGYLVAASQPFLVKSTELFESQYSDVVIHFKRMDPEAINHASRRALSI